MLTWFSQALCFCVLLFWSLSAQIMIKKSLNTTLRLLGKYIGLDRAADSVRAKHFSETRQFGTSSNQMESNIQILSVMTSSLTCAHWALQSIKTPSLIRAQHRYRGWFCAEKIENGKNFFSQKLVYKTNLKHCNVPHLAPEMIESVYTVISVIYYISVI